MCEREREREREREKKERVCVSVSEYSLLYFAKKKQAFNTNVICKCYFLILNSMTPNLLFSVLQVYNPSLKLSKSDISKDWQNEQTSQMLENFFKYNPSI